ncbi:proline hydroxylase, partial [Brevundimonas sp. MYb33]
MTDTLDWPRIAHDLNAQGWAVAGPLLTPATCGALQALYDQPERFRSRIVMQRHGFGQG